MKFWVGLAVTAAVTVTAGCGTETAVDRERASVGVSPESSQIQQAADEILIQMGGSAEQREARYYLEFLDANQSYEQCMQAQGINFVAEYHTSHVGFVPDGTVGQWMGALGRKPSTGRLANVEAAYDDATGNLPVKYRTPDFEQAQAACDTSRPPNGAPERSPIPQGASASYFAMLASVDHQLGPIAPYTGCMRDAGIDYTGGSDGGEGWTGLYLYLVGSMPRPPLPGADPSEEWTRYLSLERRSLSADAACRTDQYTKGLQLLSLQLPEFQAKYASVLQASAKNWQSFVPKAKSAGFTFRAS